MQVKCKKRLEHSGIVTYSEVASHVLGPWGQRIVEVLLILSQSGANGLLKLLRAITYLPWQSAGVCTRLRGTSMQHHKQASSQVRKLCGRLVMCILTCGSINRASLASQLPAIASVSNQVPSGTDKLLCAAGFCVAYLIFIAQNLASISHVKGTMYVLGACPVLLALAMLRGVHALAPFSLIADAANILGESCVADLMME